MKDLTTYLIFDGNCREAMTFYAKCLGGELELMPFSLAPGQNPPGSENRIMHAKITKSSPILMASDTMPGMPFQQGNNFSISVHCDTLEEIERLFNGIGENGTVKMALQDTFWGARFGMLIDQFGVHWMFNMEHAKQAKAE